MTPIVPITEAFPGVAPVTGGQPGSGTAAVPFSQVVGGLLADASHQHREVSSELARVVSGESNDVHDLVLSVARADLAFKMVVEVRDQLISAYQEIMRMQV